MEKLKGILCIVLSSVCFGIMPLLAKIAYNNGINTYSLLFFRFLFATLILTIYIKVKKIKFNLSVRQIIYIIFIGVLGYSASSITLFTSYKYIPVGMASMIVYTYPVIVTFLSFFIYKERLSSKKTISLLTSSIGVYMLIGNTDISFNLKGVMLALAAALFYSLYVIGTSNKIIKDVNAYVMTFILSVIAGSCMVLMGIMSNQLTLTLNVYTLICILLLSIISTVIALMTFIQGIKLIGPSTASILSNLEPVVAMVLGIIILGEKISFFSLAGSILILASAIIISLDFRNN